MSKAIVDTSNIDDINYLAPPSSPLDKPKLMCSKGEVILPDITNLTPQQVVSAKLEIKGFVDTIVDVLLQGKAALMNVHAQITLVIDLRDVDLSGNPTVAEIIADLDIDFSSMSGAYEYTEVALTGVSESE